MASMANDKQLGDLIRRAQQGDLAAIEALVRRYQEPVRAWVAAHCPPGGDGDEVAQRTFIAAIGRLADFQEGTSFRAWLFAIARFQLMTETTRLRRLADYQTRYGPDLLSRELERRAQQPDELAEARLHHLRECLAVVGEQGRQFIHGGFASLPEEVQQVTKYGRTNSRAYYTPLPGRWHESEHFNSIGSSPRRGRIMA